MVLEKQTKKQIVRKIVTLIECFVIIEFCFVPRQEGTYSLSSADASVGGPMFEVIVGKCDRWLVFCSR